MKARVDIMEQLLFQCSQAKSQSFLCQVSWKKKKKKIEKEKKKDLWLLTAYISVLYHKRVSPVQYQFISGFATLLMLSSQSKFYSGQKNKNKNKMVQRDMWFTLSHIGALHGYRSTVSKSMVYDLENKYYLQAIKKKVVVVDQKATWCGKQYGWELAVSPIWSQCRTSFEIFLVFLPILLLFLKLDI